MGLNLTSAAKELGISHVALLKAAQAGRVTAEPDGTYDVESCREQMAKNSNPRHVRLGKLPKLKGKAKKTASSTAPSDESLAEAARLHEWEKLRFLQQKTDREAGLLADVAVVNAFVAGMIMAARDQLTRIGAEIADRVAQESDPVKCRKAIDDRIFQVLENLRTYTNS